MNDRYTSHLFKNSLSIIVIFSILFNQPAFTGTNTSNIDKKIIGYIWDLAYIEDSFQLESFIIEKDEFQFLSVSNHCHSNSINLFIKRDLPGLVVLLIPSVVTVFGYLNTYYTQKKILFQAHSDIDHFSELLESLGTYFIAVLFIYKLNIMTSTFALNKGGTKSTQYKELIPRDFNSFKNLSGSELQKRIERLNTLETIIDNIINQSFDNKAYLKSRNFKLYD
ncbi:hypothetical protein OAB57_00060 [Bacteriovoracaceae bacterium]|nr:hypothetical protein [Bacteriovoracaceae bacterium]